MRTKTRLVLEMGGRSATFCRANPDDDPIRGQVPVRLFGLMDRAEELVEQQRSGAVVLAAVTAEKAEARIALEQNYSALVKIGKAAAKVRPDITVHRRLPKAGTSEATFLASVRVAVADATAAKDLLAPFGLTDALLTTMTGQITGYGAIIVRRSNATAAQVGASAELDVVAPAIMTAVKNLDAVHHLRFGKDPEKLAAWKSARNVAWPAATPATVPEADPTPAPAPVQSGAPGAAPSTGTIRVA